VPSAQLESSVKEKRDMGSICIGIQSTYTNTIPLRSHHPGLGRGGFMVVGTLVLVPNPPKCIVSAQRSLKVASYTTSRYLPDIIDHHYNTCNSGAEKHRFVLWTGWSRLPCEVCFLPLLFVLCFPRFLVSKAARIGREAKQRCLAKSTPAVVD